jgi:hypothetical protein
MLVVVPRIWLFPESGAAISTGQDSSSSRRPHAPDAGMLRRLLRVRVLGRPVYDPK